MLHTPNRSASLVMLSRRQWVHRVTATAFGVGAMRFAQPAAFAIDAIQRNGSKLKLSLAAYSYRDLLQSQPAQLSLEGFIDDAARFGLEAVELTSYYFPADVSRERLQAIRQYCFHRGLDVSGTAVGNDFGLPPGPKRDEQIGMVHRWVENAVAMGAPVIRIFAGHVPNGESADVAEARMIEAMEACCDFAGQHGIHLALENHGGPTATADGLLRFVKAVKSPWFGVNLDTGNFASDDVYGDLSRIAPFAINVQAKVMIADKQGNKTPTDWQRLASILRDANYRGYVALEFEEAGDPRSQCAQHLDAMRKAFDA